MEIKAKTEYELQALLADLNAELGYPCEGVAVGGGIHVPPELARTERYSNVKVTKDGASLEVPDKASEAVTEFLVATLPLEPVVK